MPSNTELVTEQVIPGVAVGDVVLELEGVPIPGAKGDALDKIEAVLDKRPKVGDQLLIKLQRSNGQVYEVVLVAEPRN